MSTSTCTTFAQTLQAISGQIGPIIYKQTLTSNRWMNRIKQSAWPDGHGAVISLEIMDITLPPGGGNFIPVTQLSDTINSKSCGMYGQDIQFGNNLRQFSQFKAAFNTPDFCVDKAVLTWEHKQQLNNLYDLLKELTIYIWDTRYRSEYSRLANNHVLLTADYQTNITQSGMDFNSGMPQYRMSQSVLDWAYEELLRQGASEHAYTKETGGEPIFEFVSDHQVSRQIITDNPDIRQDYRYGTKADDLQAPLGLKRAYKGFAHNSDFLPRRFNYVAGAWVEYDPWLSVPGATGFVRIPNPEYDKAVFTDSYIFVEQVFESLIPAPQSTLGGDTKFTPVNYRGDFRFVEPGRSRDCNPDGDKGWFRAVFKHGSMTIKPEFGYVFRHMRCLYQDLVGCPTGYSS